MFAMLKQLWHTLEVFFMAGEKLANAVNNLAEVAEETSAAFADEARIKRGQQAAALTKANASIKKIEAA